MARSALLTGTTTAFAWMFVSIGVATGLGVGGGRSSVGRALGVVVCPGVDVRRTLGDALGEGLGPTSRPPKTTSQPPMSRTTATTAATEVARFIACARPIRPYPS